MSCTCHSIREGSAGSYSLAMLGVQCGHCEAINAEYERQAWWDSLTVKEQIAERWSWAVSRVSYSWQRRPMRNIRAHLPEPPF